MRPVATLSSFSQMETALRWQASGQSSLVDRSVLNLRTGCSLFSSYAAVVMRRAELVIRSNRSVNGQRSGQPLRQESEGVSPFVNNPVLMTLNNHNPPTRYVHEGYRHAGRCKDNWNRGNHRQRSGVLRMTGYCGC